MSTQPKLASHTGLRGVAILCVVWDHYAIWCAPFNPRTWPWPLDHAFNTGGIGMSIFFALSGFVIAYNYLGLDWMKAPAASAANFAWLRFSRLYPCLLVFIAVTAIQPGTLQLGHRYPLVTGLSLMSFQSFYPVKLAGDLITDNGYNLAWSISTEIGLYALFVFALVLHGQMNRIFGAVATKIAVLIGGAYVAAVAWLLWHPELAAYLADKLPVVGEPLTRDEAARWLLYWSPFCRFYDFLFGWLAAAMMRANIFQDGRIAGGATMSFAILVTRFIFHPDAYTMQSECAPLLTLIMVVGSQSAIINRSLSAPWLVYIGEISYSLYLFHSVATHMASIPQSREFSWPLFAGFLVLFCLCLVLALSLATGLYRLIEMPGQRVLRERNPFRKQ